jgi:alanyl-tRNA synthetase
MSSSKISSEDVEWTTDKVRSTFCEFFQEREHTLQASSACAPLNDPTLLFTNAGMNQWKPIFLGQVDPNSPLATLKRAVNSQKCIRAGGKHNDLEDVGRDTYHHTFFEMLGSWSFGDYFKREAIDMAWKLLTEVYKLDPDRIYATYFEGDDNVEVDTEARDFWLKYLPQERVIGCSAKDNFWEVRSSNWNSHVRRIEDELLGSVLSSREQLSLKFLSTDEPLFLPYVTLDGRHWAMRTL